MKAQKFKGFSYDDGRIVNAAYFNGYHFGDRLLEGVMFKATVSKDGFLQVEHSGKNKNYWKMLNNEYWLKAALEFAENNDIFSEKIDGGEDLLLEINE